MLDHDYEEDRGWGQLCWRFILCTESHGYMQMDLWNCTSLMPQAKMTRASNWNIGKFIERLSCLQRITLCFSILWQVLHTISLWYKKLSHTKVKMMIFRYLKAVLLAYMSEPSLLLGVYWLYDILFWLTVIVMIRQWPTTTWLHVQLTKFGLTMWTLQMHKNIILKVKGSKHSKSHAKSLDHAH